MKIVFSNSFISKIKKVGLVNMLKDFMYRFDWRKPDVGSVKEFLQDNISIGYQLKSEGKLPHFTGSRDYVMLKILKWVRENITYLPDIKRFNTVEKWQNVDETLTYKTGDCEDGAILIYVLARLHRINPAQLYLTTGNVKTRTGKGGHCYINYIADYKLDDSLLIPYTIDWCYYSDNRNFENRQKINRDLYLDEWFSISSLEVK